MRDLAPATHLSETMCLCLHCSLHPIWYAEARRELSGCSTLELDFETHILPDPASAYRAVCNYVEVEPTPVRIRHQRVNPFPLAELVSNYQEIESLLRGTDFEWMLAKERWSG